MIISSELNDIQPRSTPVWNCDQIGFDPNGRRNKVICNCKLLQGEQMRKVQTGELAPLCWTLLVFNQDYEKWFMSPIIVN